MKTESPNDNQISLKQLLSSARAELLRTPVRTTGIVLGIAFTVFAIILAVVTALATVWNWVAMAWLGGSLLYFVWQLRSPKQPRFPERGPVQIGTAVAGVILMSAGCGSIAIFYLAIEIGRLEGALYAIETMSRAMEIDTAHTTMEDKPFSEVIKTVVTVMLERPRLFLGATYGILSLIGLCQIAVEVAKYVALNHAVIKFLLGAED